MYKGNERMGIRKKGEKRKIYGNTKGIGEWAYKNKEMTGEIYCCTKGMGRWGHTMLLLSRSDQDLTWVYAPLGCLYLLPSFSSQSLLLQHLSSVTEVVSLDSKSMS
jgi:hypothetical protein